MPNLSIHLYIHVPFCTKHCPYCAFFKRTDQPDPDAYLAALDREMAWYADQLRDRQVITVFFGGGTPNWLSSEQLTRILRGVSHYFDVDSNCEITMEMNPELVTEAQLRQLRAEGLNRVSLGIQSFNAGILQMLGRDHTTKHIDGAIRALNRVGLDSFNLDLIFGVPGQSLAICQQDLETALSYNPTHLSTYALTIEPGTTFAKQRVQPATDDLSLQMYSHIRRQLQREGFDHYEVSAFAKPGYRCRHNLGYWTLSDYIGLGPSGSSYWQGRYYKNPNDYDRYCENPMAAAQQSLAQDPLAWQDQFNDFMVSSLRCRDGVLLSTAMRRFGVDVLEHFAKDVDHCQAQGWVSVRKGRLRATVKGLFVLDSVTECFML